MKKTMTFAIAVSMLTLALAASSQPAAASTGKHIPRVIITPREAPVPQWLQILATVLGF